MTVTPLELFKALGINPEPKTHAEYLAAWEQLKDLAKVVSDTEMTMRKALFAATFPAPKEGANNFTLADGRKLAASFKINRTIDASQVAIARADYELVNERPVLFDELLKVSYDLVISAYRKLEPKAGEAPSQAFLAASRMIISKPGAPSMEVK